MVRGGQKKIPSESISEGIWAVRTGLEPATPGVTGLYSNRLNYRTILFALGEASALLLLRVQSYSTFLIRPNILMKKFSLKWFLSYFANILSFISCFSGFRKLLFRFRICCVFLRTVESWASMGEIATLNCSLFISIGLKRSASEKTCCGIVFMSYVFYWEIWSSGDSRSSSGLRSNKGRRRFTPSSMTV